jgi:hypothetical protein
VAGRASTGLEFRYSLLRDVFKVGLFYNQVLFGELDRTLNAWSVQSAVFVAVGWKTDGTTDFAPGLVLRQVF